MAGERNGTTSSQERADIDALKAGVDLAPPSAPAKEAPWPQRGESPAGTRTSKVARSSASSRKTVRFRGELDP